MRYTWRLILALIILSVNLVNNLSLGDFSLSILFSLFINGAIGWIIGLQIDKYLYSKKELGSTKKTLFDYALALDSVAEATGIINETGQFVFVNEAFTRLYGYSKKELLIINWLSCYPEETMKCLKDTAVPELYSVGQWKGEAVGLKNDGTSFPQEISLSLIKDSKNIIFIARDITEQKSYEASIQYVAEHNDLTDLPNRRRLLYDLSTINNKLTKVSLLFLDLDRFKLINDNFGHDIGDELLKSVAKRLNSFKNEFVNIYHHGGDEFIIVIQNTNIAYLENITYAISEKIKEPYYINGIEVLITASIGISMYPNHANKKEDLIKSADTAMYYAKLEGKDTFKFFNKKLETQLERKSMIESELRKALKKEELYILYQPKFNLDSFEIMGMEALIRWEHPELGLVLPDEFITAAEESGLIVDIGKWVIHEAVQQIRTWRNEGYPYIKISVNVSSKQFRDKELVQTIRSSLHKYNIDPSYFEIEITESVIADPELCIPILNALKEIGISVSIDDFGKGYSSFNILKDLPIDTLKIDKSFIHDLFGNPKDELLIRAILRIGDILGLNVVAEGIETQEQLNNLLMHGCQIGQGYYFSKPIEASVAENRFFIKEYVCSK